jgi:hypothetical protein
MLKFLLSRLPFDKAAPAGMELASRPCQTLSLQWLRDPLSHSALEPMSERELGDLPFRR